MWRRVEVLAVTGTPLQPNPSSEDTRIRTKMDPGLASSEIVGDPVTQQDVKAALGEQRPFYLMRTDVREAAKKYLTEELFLFLLLRKMD